MKAGDVEDVVSKDSARIVDLSLPAVAILSALMQGLRIRKMQATSNASAKGCCWS